MLLDGIDVEVGNLVLERAVHSLVQREPQHSRFLRHSKGVEQNEANRAGEDDSDESLQTLAGGLGALHGGGLAGDVSNNFSLVWGIRQEAGALSEHTAQQLLTG